jgi:DEAD/DEAH box helicase domain-containing protein
MIPSILVHQLRKGISDFIRTTFPVSTPYFHGIVDRLMNGEGNVFKGPYLSIQLPFRTGTQDENYFPDVPMKFAPYLHQELAFVRLGGVNPKSTIISTGTGSGKTESFLFPILNYCNQHKGEPGIKAILIYPMRALATDQANRIAQIIYDNPNLKGHITAGLYIGQKEEVPQMVMSRDGIITNKETMRLTPPDILLTDYKMLDYLLIRAKDYPLWKDSGPETLRYLVIDELHTFEGAQGTDLACLLRRLKVRLSIPERHLCCIGTSATLGDKQEQTKQLSFAGEIFGETFDRDAIIIEHRLSAREFLEKSLISRIELVPTEKATELRPESYDSYSSFVQAQYRLWFGENLPDDSFTQETWRVKLGEQLKELLFFQNLLKVLSGQIKSYEEVIEETVRVTPGVERTDNQYVTDLLNSLLTLVSLALIDNDGKTSPFLQVRYQFWMRELRRMIGSLSNIPQIAFADDLTEEQLQKHLPLVHCRECGSMGWTGIRRPNDNRIETELQNIYAAFFHNDPKICFLFPESENLNTKESEGVHFSLCQGCLTLFDTSNTKTCPGCGQNEATFVFIPHSRVRTRGRISGLHNCPFCNAHGSLVIIGSRAASLTSVFISQLYSSPYNDDKKLLTFSDSVQDAAHRAGFFAARTYRFNLRAAMQQFVMNQNPDLSLEQVMDSFWKYWSDIMDEQTFIATFLPPDLAWMRDYDLLKNQGKLPDDSRLKEYVINRMKWEVLREYGFSARLGRTLEKTGASVVCLNSQKLDKTIERILDSLRNETDELRDLSVETLQWFISGLIVHLKNKGGIDWNEFSGYIESWGNTYKLSVIPWMQNFGVRTRAPSYLTTANQYRFDALFESVNRRTWYEHWLDKCFNPLLPFKYDISGALFNIILSGLVEEGILVERRLKNERVWGIQPNALTITLDVSQVQCNKCGHQVSAGDSEADRWERSPCLRYSCDGQYMILPKKDDYYRTLYTSGDIKRIFAAEHTGMLGRDERETLELQFKRTEGKPWDPNLLSCTPTLELGIDIGNLSSVILCSVPPTQANYLQRIGRAGRRDGNALNVTVANGRPHDLYFFSDPGQMISGNVETPGIFLNASAVLERQFTAFCLDSWVESGIDQGAMPDQLRQVLTNLDKQNNEKFPYNFIRFIENHQTKLFDRFLNMFEGILSEETRNYLSVFISGNEDQQGSLPYKILEGLHLQKRERDSLKKKVNTLTSKIRTKKNSKIKDKNYETDLEELNQEKKALQELMKTILDKHTLNFLTDEGLIPNYAFPEAGVMLRSIIYRKKGKFNENESKYDTWVYEYERPAKSAISELVPSNYFYAGGRKVRIDQVDLSVSEIETWRFCTNCSHLEMEGVSDATVTCIRCGSTMWSDSGQKKKMLRMRTVFSSTSDRDSRISDDSDDREPGFFNKQMLIDHDDKNITDAFRVDNDAFPFGFEFLSKATFREINFGEKLEVGEKVTIAGVHIPRKGFEFCKYCGKIHDTRGKISHALTCTSRNMDSDENLTECVYLYREFASEAIRILLPVTTFSGSEQKQHSFIAALQMGLKRVFGGSIDHLQTTLCDEPVPNSSYRKKYLVLYDTVPGGTGYLKQLMRSQEPLIEVFEKAIEILRSCSCNLDPEKDGCYQCLFAYRSSYNMAGTSRDSAIELLDKILQYRDQFKKTKDLKDISVNVLFDSELEVRFIEALKRARSETLPVKLEKSIVGGKPGYFLIIGERSWYIELQASLGHGDGINVPSKADFIFHPARKHKTSLPVVVFTDGYFYHRDRVGKDISQRLAIIQSRKYHVWSLSWKDVENRFKNQGDFFVNLLNTTNLNNQAQKLNQFFEHYGVNNLRKIHQGDSFSWLIRFLADPDAGQWQTCAFVHSLMQLDFSGYSTPESVNQWFDDLDNSVPDGFVQSVKQLEGNCLYGFNRVPASVSDQLVKSFMVIGRDAVNEKDADKMRFICSLVNYTEQREKKKFESHWNGFLRLLNLFQFLPHCLFSTAEGFDENAFQSEEVELEPEISVSAFENAEDGWREALFLCDVVFHDLLNRLRKNNWLPPEIGFELINSKGEIVAEAELAWIANKIAVLSETQTEHLGIFKSDDWEVFTLVEALSHDWEQKQ